MVLAVRIRLILFFIFTILFIAGMAGSALAHAQDQPQGPHALVIKVDGIINDVKGRYIERTITLALEDQAELVIIELDTPGGLLSLLADCLDAGDLSASKLSQYHRRWRELLSRELEVGYSARRLFEFLNDLQIGALTRQAVAAGVHIDLTSSPDVSFDWHSRAIAKIMGYPALGGALRLINPILARFANQPEPEFEIPLVSATQADNFARRPN